MNSIYMREKGRPLNLDKCGRRQRSKCDASKDDEGDSGYQIHDNVCDHRRQHDCFKKLNQAVRDYGTDEPNTGKGIYKEKHG